MKTFQDFEKAIDKNKFILQLIEDFKNSDFYNKAIDAQEYYRGNNTTIMNRKPVIWTSNGQREDIFRANNQVANEFFPEIIKQEVSYLLSNGLTTDDKIKEGLGDSFDIRLQKIGTYALVDGVGWGYCYLSSKGFSVDVWRGTEAIPLFDERRGILRALVRFWQIDTDKPIFIELYEEDGKTEFETSSDSIGNIKDLKVTANKKAYVITKQKTFLEERVVDEFNWSTLPIFPLYANDIKESEFTRGLKSKIDLYDTILSDFGNTLEDSRDVFWVLKNYNGQDINDFIRDYKEYKAIKIDDDGEATPHTIDIPWEARKTALDMIKQQIYSDAMALDSEALSRGTMTNDHIKAMYSKLDLKTDGFENCVFEFVNNIISLYLEYNKKNDKIKFNFIRNRLISESEKIDNIYKMRTDISHETALRLNPYIENVVDEIEKFEEEGINKYNIATEEEV